jgi:hypothetical protein
MTAFTNQSLADGQATPVQQTFSPLRKGSDGIAYWACKAGGIAMGYPVVSQALKTPATTADGQEYHRVVLKVTIPVLDLTVPSAPKAKKPLIAVLEFAVPASSTLAQRNDLISYIRALAGNAPALAAVRDFEGVFG